MKKCENDGIGRARRDATPALRSAVAAVNFHLPSFLSSAYTEAVVEISAAHPSGGRMLMSSNGNSHSHANSPQSRGSLRFDPPGHGMEGAPGVANAGGWFASGRVLVITIVVVVLVVWGALNVVFRQWRGRYLARRAHAEQVVAARVEPLAQVVPADAHPDSWRAAVAETRAMLKTVTDSNMLTDQAIESLSAEISVLVRDARPDDARARLAAVWDRAEAGAGPIVTTRHPRPRLLPPRRPKP